MNKTMIIFITLIVCAGLVRGKGWYVAPDGVDTNTGTVIDPFYSIATAASRVSAGDTIYVSGGIYKYKATIRLTASGTASARICIIACKGELPVLDFSEWIVADKPESDSSRGMLITGSFWYIEGLEIHHAPDNGIKIEGSAIVVTRCVLHHNGDSGLQIGLTKNDSSNATVVADNQVINCDSYRNYDSYTKGANADGFACKLFPGEGNSFYGCRAWENSDDGFDFYHTEYRITVDRCWTWHNGDYTLFQTDDDWSGNGQGFKLGDGNAPHLIKNSVAFDHKYTDGNNKGFDQNSNEGPVTVLNCTGWDNEINFYFGSGHAANILKNNVGFGWTTKNISIVDESEQANNCWNLAGITADAADFKDLSPDAAMAPREPDGSLPDNGFARLVNGSDLIDKGVDVGIPFTGAAPDLGAFEYDPVPVIIPAESSPVPSGFRCHPDAMKCAVVVEFMVTKPGPVLITIYNLFGKKMIPTQQFIGLFGVNRQKINLEHMHNGVFIIALKDSGGCKYRTMHVY